MVKLDVAVRVTAFDGSKMVVTQRVPATLSNLWMILRYTTRKTFVITSVKIVR